jgi:hypothetical protein
MRLRKEVIKMAKMKRYRNCKLCRNWDHGCCRLGFTFQGTSVHGLELVFAFMEGVRDGIACCSEFDSLKLR